MSALKSTWWKFFLGLSLFLVGNTAFFYSRTDETLFSRQKGKYLPNHVTQAKHTESEFECSTLCSNDESCSSVNYKHAGDKSGLCELNGASLENHTNEVLEKPEFSHLVVTKRNCKERQQLFSQNSKKCVDVGSCEAAYNEDGSLPNGPYYLNDNNSDQKYPVYCHMSEIDNCGGGGWTLVLKTDGSKSTFKYSSPYWSDLKTYKTNNGEEGLTDNESKLPSYWKTPFTKICVGMKVDGVTRWMKLDYTASSLYSVLADGVFRETTAGRSAWKALIDGSSLQMNCNKEGFNVRTTSSLGYFNGRLAIVGNNQNDCLTPDSYIGFGVSATTCHVTSKITSGNKAMCSGTDNGPKNTPAIGYILVQ